MIFLCGAMPLQAEPVSYQKQIKPLLDRLCVECHSGWFPQAGLRLDTLDNIYEGSPKGPVIFPGEPDKGKLINMIRSVPGRFSIMPPGPKGFNAQQFELFRQWIEQGAK